MRKAMFISVIFSTLCLSLLMIPSSGDADFYVIPVGRQAKIDPADVVHAETLFDTDPGQTRRFNRRLPDGTYETAWQVPAGKKLVITDLTVSPFPITDGSKSYFKLGWLTGALVFGYLQEFLVRSGQDCSYSFGVGIVVNSGKCVVIKPMTGATSGGVAFINGYLIDN